MYYKFAKSRLYNDFNKVWTPNGNQWPSSDRTFTKTSCDEETSGYTDNTDRIFSLGIYEVFPQGDLKSKNNTDVKFKKSLAKNSPYKSGLKNEDINSNSLFEIENNNRQHCIPGSNGLLFRRFLPEVSIPEVTRDNQLERRLVRASSEEQFYQLPKKKKRNSQHFPRRFSETGVRFLETSQFRPSSFYSNFVDYNMTDQENRGTLNPAYSPDQESKTILTDLDRPINVTSDEKLLTILDNGKDKKNYTLPVPPSEREVGKDDVVKSNDVIVNVDKQTTTDTSNSKSNQLDSSSGKSESLTLEINKNGKNKGQVSPPVVHNEDMKWLLWLEGKFKQIAGDDGEIDLQEFKQALGTRQNFFATRFFNIFDQDGSGTIELGELMDGLTMLMKGTPAQKLQFLFNVYDVDGSGSIDREELKNVLKACMEESSLRLTEDNLEDLTDVLFMAADEDESGEITFEELKAELEKHPGVIDNLTISAAQWLKGPEQTKDDKPAFRYFTKDYVRNNVRKVIFFLVYWVINIVLFCVAVWQYRDSNRWIHVARGCGLCLNFNCMWVLVLMLRQCITLLRMTQLSHVLPLDQHILFHKMTGIAIAGFSLVHTLAHIGNAVVVSDQLKNKFDPVANTTGPGLEIWEVLFTLKAGIGWVEASAFVTGWALDVILVIIVICSMPFVRRSGHFQIFYWSHMLYIPFWVLVILHGPHFWKWFVFPGFLFLIEKISRSKLFKMARFGDTYIEEVNLLASGVTHLIISRPLNFKYQPGDYLFIQIPAIAKQEWHPFTISSAPEMEDYLWLHVRSAGHWTNKLYKYFDELKVDDVEAAREKRRPSKAFGGFEKAYSRRNVKRATKNGEEKKKQTHKLVRVKCFLDGPYGTGTREVFGVQHAVLIASGIGVTPMAAILQSVWYKFIEARQTCPKCEHVWYGEEDAIDMKLKKVDFIWINRDQKSFEWFLTLLNQLEVEQISHGGPLENCIQTHLYMTAAQKKTDMKGIGLQIALDMIHERQQKDLITGLRTKTNPGRPEWDEIFKAIKNENKGKVKVFFCGNPALAKTVKESTTKFGFAFSKENF